MSRDQRPEGARGDDEGYLAEGTAGYRWAQGIISRGAKKIEWPCLPRRWVPTGRGSTQTKRSEQMGLNPEDQSRADGEG